MAPAIPPKLTAQEIKDLTDKQVLKIKAQVEKLCGVHRIDDFDPDLFDPEDRSVFQIPVYHYQPDVSGFSVRRCSSGVAIRGERGQFKAVIKKAREVVKALNAGEELSGIIGVPTGRPKGRPKLPLA
jgi:hypothetical protein